MTTRATVHTSESDLGQPAHLVHGDDAVLSIRRLVVEYSTPAGTVHAVSDVSLDLGRNETLGLVGESGCGKSSAGRAVLMLPPPTSGEVLLEGQDLTRMSGPTLRRARRHLQMVFQDPLASLNPRRRIWDIVTEGLVINDLPINRAEVEEAIRAVGLDPDAVANRRPRGLSGGQAQRIAIARALVLDPTVIVCDEPVSAVDVSVQAQILNLLEDMKARYGLSLLFVSHDLAVVKNISDRVAVMYLGKLCEIAPSDSLYREPLHPYTKALLHSVQDPDPANATPPPQLRTGQMPSPLAPPSGCRFRTRCPLAMDVCAVEEPELRQASDGHFVACHAVDVQHEAAAS